MVREPVPPIRDHAVVVLLLVPDPERRRQVADACHAAHALVSCITPADDAAAMYAAPPDRVDLVVVDAGLAAARGRGWLANLRRLAPRGNLLILGSDHEHDLGRVRQALRRRLDARTVGRRP